MKQSKKNSFIEALTNVVVGYFLAVGTQILIYPFFGMKVSIYNNFIIGLIFLVVSLSRSYIIRRFFTKKTE